MSLTKKNEAQIWEILWNIYEMSPLSGRLAFVRSVARYKKYLEQSTNDGFSMYEFLQAFR